MQKSAVLDHPLTSTLARAALTILASAAGAIAIMTVLLAVLYGLVLVGLPTDAPSQVPPAAGSTWFQGVPR